MSERLKAGVALGANIFAKISQDGKQVLRLLQQEGPLTKNALMEAIKTNFTTLNRIIRPLKEARLVSGVGLGKSSGGRRPVLYDLNPKGFYLLGLDISRASTQLVIADPKMTILSRDAFSMDDSYTPEKTVQHVACLFDASLNRLGLHRDEFLGAGLGTVGPLDRQGGTMIQPANFAAPGWIGVQIRDLLERCLGLPVEIDNGANTAVLAEYLFGIGKGRANLAYFNCSIGIRTGVISAGKIVRSINDAEDAFGHMAINIDDEPCVCGNYGCLECYSTVHAIVRKYGTAVKQGRYSGIAKPMEQIDWMDICLAAQNGELLAREVITNAATILGIGLANCINLLNPELVILGGLLIGHSELYYQTCTTTAAKRLYTKEPDRITFNKGGRFGDNAMAVGAAAMVVQSHLS